MKNVNVSSLLIGLVLGVVLTGVVAWKMMPGMMIVEQKSKFPTVEETIQQLQASIVANGWISPAVRDMNKSVEKMGFSIDKPVKIVELCKQEYAADILTGNPEMATMLPCAWGVYTNEKGEVMISGMNMGLMGKMFGGNIANIIGGKVAIEEHAILEKVVE